MTRRVREAEAEAKRVGRWCTVCRIRYRTGWVLCRACARSYDKQTDLDCTTAGIIRWAVERALRSAARRGAP